jgi:zinc transporter, ZIP family
VLEAVGWGAIAASSLVIGAILGLARNWPEGLVGAVLAFGAGALISAVSFELAEEGIKLGDDVFVAAGLALGAATYFGANRELQRRGKRGTSSDPSSAGDEASGDALALGAFLDGIPEQLVLGIGTAAGDGISIGLLVAIFVSNLPEAIGSATDMRDAGSRPGAVRRLWILVAAACTLASAVGYLLADVASANAAAAIDGFAAGALLVMLVDSMIPEAVRKGGDKVGLVTVLGFAVATGLSGIS